MTTNPMHTAKAPLISKEETIAGGRPLGQKQNLPKLKEMSLFQHSTRGSILQKTPSHQPYDVVQQAIPGSVP